MKFAEIEKLAYALRDKRKKYVSVSVVRHSYFDGSSETEYKFYIDGQRTIFFKTAQELRAHMENILNPPADEGVELSDLAEDGVLRGAE